jgi:dynein light chain 1
MLSRLRSLEILSLGRNNIKKIEGLDGVADTLKELWISYNNIEKMAGIEKLKSLEILYM